MGFGVNPRSGQVRYIAERTDGNLNTYALVASPEIVAAIAIVVKIRFQSIDRCLDK